LFRSTYSGGVATIHYRDQILTTGSWNTYVPFGDAITSLSYGRRYLWMILSNGQVYCADRVAGTWHGITGQTLTELDAGDTMVVAIGTDGKLYGRPTDCTAVQAVWKEIPKPTTVALTHVSIGKNYVYGYFGTNLWYFHRYNGLYNWKQIISATNVKSVDVGYKTGATEDVYFIAGSVVYVQTAGGGSLANTGFSSCTAEKVSVGRSYVFVSCSDGNVYRSAFPAASGTWSLVASGGTGQYHIAAEW
jgi:hypothetical protein